MTVGKDQAIPSMTVGKDQAIPLINNACSELSIHAEENMTGENIQCWACTCIRGGMCSFVIIPLWQEHDMKVEFRFISGCRCAFSDILKEISSLIGVEIRNCGTFYAPVLDTSWTPSEEDLRQTAAYVCELITASSRNMCLIGLVALTNVMTEKLVWHLGPIYETILERGHSHDEEIAATAILCLNKYVNFLVFTKQLSHAMCSILERCRDPTPYHVKREALNFAVTMSLKTPVHVLQTGILTFACPNKDDMITFHYVARINQILHCLS